MSNTLFFYGNLSYLIEINVKESTVSFMEYYWSEVARLEFDSEPPYAKIQSKITDALKLLGQSSSSVDNFRLFSAKNIPKTPSNAHVYILKIKHTIIELLKLTKLFLNLRKKEHRFLLTQTSQKC